MQTQYVLRVEHPVSGKGPFFHDWKPKPGLASAITGYSNHLPQIIDDVIDYEEMQYSTHVCGVEYMSQLFEWFGPNLNFMYEAGFRLFMYLMPVSKVLKCTSGIQVAFNKSDALEVTQLA